MRGRETKSLGEKRKEEGDEEDEEKKEERTGRGGDDALPSHEKRPLIQ